MTTYAILNTIISNDNNNYYSKDFTNELDKFVSFFKSANSTINQMVSSTDGYRYKNNLTGYLFSINVRLSLHYLVMRMNGIDSVYDFGPHVTSLLLPSENEFTKVATLIRTNKGSTI